MIITTPPEVVDASRYCTSAAARILGIDRKTLRRYAAQSGISPHVSKAGRTIYTGAMLRRIWAWAN